MILGQDVRNYLEVFSLIIIYSFTYSYLFLGIQDATKEKVKKATNVNSNPLNYLDPLNEQLESIQVKSVASPVRPDLLNPHLKRVVSNRGRKQTLKTEQDQFRKVMSHPAFMNNPLGAIGMHLTNTINQIKTLPSSKKEKD